MPDDLDILNTILEDDHREEWEDEWMCPSCEYGPMASEANKCERCGCKKDQKFNEHGLDDDGWGEETEEVEEIYYD